jgi:hypothetical protein
MIWVARRAIGADRKARRIVGTEAGVALDA